MSIQAFRWAKAEILARNGPKSLRRDPLSPSETFVLIMLGDHYNEDWGRAWPSQSTLALETGFSVKTITRAVEGLRERGLVLSEPWVMNDGDYRMPYRYLLPRHRPEVKLATELPVLAFLRAEGEYGSDSMVEVPGSNLVIDAWTLGLATL